MKTIVLENLEQYRIYLENKKVGMPQLGCVVYHAANKIYEIELIYDVKGDERVLGSYMLDTDGKIIFPRADNGVEKDIVCRLEYYRRK